MLNSTTRNIKTGFNSNRLLFCSLLFLIGHIFNVNAQKKPLDHEVYDDWQSFGKIEISDDGKWSAYTVKPQEGDKWLYFQNNENQTPEKKCTEEKKQKSPQILIVPFF